MRKRAFVYLAGSLALIVAGLWLYASREIGRIEPLIRQRAVEYLSTRFDSQVSLAEFHVRLPHRNVFASFFRRNRGLVAEIEGRGLVMEHHRQTGLPPMFRIQSFRASIGFEGLFRPARRISTLEIDGMEIRVPPREDTGPAEPQPNGPVALSFGDARIRKARLILMPKDPRKEPLQFDIPLLDLKAAGEDGVVNYKAQLTNPKPPGEISSEGRFGPWERENPGATPVSGTYNFKNADLSVFPAIAGILDSSGTFSGELSAITAKGEATVPDFRLQQANNPVPLKTTFEVMVDGTNGNTELRPVHAVLGSTAFETSGAVLKHQGQGMRTIALKVKMRQGEVSDLLKLAMAGHPMLQGKVFLDASIQVPPIAERVKEKLIIDGTFQITDGLFLKSQIRQQLDTLSRRAQGEPKNLEIEDVMTDLGGKIHLENQNVEFPSLNFSVPGARVALAGTYSMQDGSIYFDGSASLDARISQTITGWKRVLAKPIDPLFSRNGAGTYLPFEIRGTSDHPKFSVSLRRALTHSSE